MALDPGFLAEHSTQPEAIKPSLLDHDQRIKPVFTPLRFLAKGGKNMRTSRHVASGHCMARHLFASWRESRHEPCRFAQFQRNENCAKSDGGSGLCSSLICFHRHDWPLESFLATSLCHGAGRYPPLMGSKEH